MVFTLAGKTYPTKVAAQKAIQAELARFPLDSSFPSSILSDLVNHYHYRAAPLHLHAIRFRKRRSFNTPGNYNFQAFFEEIGWHGISWRKCLTPPTYESELRMYFRWLAGTLTYPTRRSSPCVICGTTEGLQVDHVSPTFDEIFQQVWAVVLPSERESWAFHDWVKHDGGDTAYPFGSIVLPPDHPSLALFHDLSMNGVTQVLCASCHNKVTQDRKQTKKERST